MSLPLPERPSLDWLRKTAKQNLKTLRAQNPTARLSDAQLALARDYGFASWRQLVSHVQRLESAAPLPPIDEQTAKLFLRLVGTGQTEEVRRLLHESPRLVNAVGPHPFWGGRPQPLHVSIETKLRDIFDLLLEAGADVNGSNDGYDHWSPLMLAIQRENGDMRDQLIRRGARIGLVEALMLGDDKLLDRHIEETGSDALRQVPNNGSPLNFARTVYAVERLIELGAAVDVADRWGSRPIEALSRLGEKGATLVQRLIAHGAKASAVDYARLGDRAALESLIASQRHVVISDAVFMAAIDSRNLELLKWLLANGANLNARAEAPTFRTALHSAAWNGNLELVQLLVEAGADVIARDREHNNTPRGWAETAVTVRNDPQCREIADYLAAQEERAKS
jgi:ankyrin repeat protein